MPSNYNTQTDALTGVSTAAENPGGMTMDNTTIGSSVPKPGTFTSISMASSAIETKTSGTLSNTGLSIIAPSSAASFILPAPSSIGVFKYITRTNTSTEVVTVTSSDSFVGSTATTIMTMNAAGDGVILVSSSLTQWVAVGLSSVTLS